MKRYCLAGENIYHDSLKKLAAEGFCVKLLPQMPHLDSAIASHTDLSLALLNDTLFISPALAKAEGDFFEALANEKGLKLIKLSSSPASPYPHDVPLCIKKVGNSVIGTKASAAKEMLEYCKQNGIPFIHTNQGYAACSTLSFGNALISADASILKAAKEAGADTLRISQGNILLPPYSYGFIGGCSGVCDRTIYFNGSLDSHPDAENICDFAEKHSFSCVSLCDAPLYDIGGIIFI